MKKDENTDLLKRIIQESTHTVPSVNFNDRVINQYTSEQKAAALKPDTNYSSLLVCVSIMSLLAGFILHLKGAAISFYPIITNPEPVIDGLYIGLFAVTIFTLFTLLSDIIEDRGGIAPF